MRVGATAALAAGRTVADGPRAAGADRALLARLAAETGVQTAPHTPSFREYLTVLGQHVFKKLFGWLHVPNVNLSGVALYLEIVALVLAWLLLTGAILLVARILLAAFRRGRSREARRPAGPKGSPLEAERPSDPGFWWSRFLKALEAGDPMSALECLWFWTGNRLAGRSVDPSWTSTELLERTGRGELGTAMARLDAWRFGPEPPGRTEIEDLAGRLRESIP